MVSAYHSYFDEQHGKESHPTFYLNWNEKRPYHIDYYFIPKEWDSRVTSVAIGTSEQWGQLSDHRPLIVDIDPITA